MKTKNRLSKRTILKMLACMPFIAGCSTNLFAKQADPQQRFHGIGVILVTDAVLGEKMRGVVFSDDQGRTVLSPALISRNARDHMALGGVRIPLIIRVVWRDNPKAIWGHDGALDYEGTILGDYTIPVAERIPDSTLEDIRQHGGALRLKFRLKPDGVLLGWDIERSLPIPGCDPKVNICMGTYFFSPGGDFLETRY